MSNYKVGDKFEIEIDSEFVDENDNKLYRIKGFNSLVFDNNGLNKLKKIEPEVTPKPKTVKASKLAEDTKVLCWDCDNDIKEKRYFAMVYTGHLYAYANGFKSKECGQIVSWKHMTLEDGTVVLPE